LNCNSNMQMSSCAGLIQRSNCRCLKKFMHMSHCPQILPTAT
jgi:hypothetical protein